MNRIFKVIWNRSTQSLCVVSELAKANVKSSSEQSFSPISIGLSALLVGGLILMSPPAFSASTASSGATASGSNAAAYGINANASGAQGTALGSGAKASGNQATAVGADSVATGYAAIAIGGDDIDQARPALAKLPEFNGSVNMLYSNGSTATYVPTIASGHVATAIGVAAQASGLASNAYGINAWATGTSGIAFGTLARQSGDNSIAIGTTANAQADDAVALSPKANATGVKSLAIGYNASANQENATAIGTNAQATHIGSVALGTDSVTKAYTNGKAETATSWKAPTDNSGVGGTTGTSGSQVLEFAGAKSTTNVLSVGDSGKERQIVNVAPGQLTATSTDAVNGSQLYAVATYTGHNIQANGANTSRINNNGVVNYADGTYTTAKVTDGDNKATVSIDLVTQAITSNTEGNVSTSGTQGVAVTSNVVDAINKSGWNLKTANITGGTASGTTSKAELINPADEVTLQAGSGLNVDRSGSTVTYAVNVDNDTIKVNDNGQIYADVTDTNTQSSVSSANNEYITVTDTEVNADKETNYQIDLSTAAKTNLTLASTAVQNFTTSVNGQAVETVDQSNRDIGFVNG
ncbi:ESPR-type extended signal peptide-containing protein, partial [Lonepinella sp. BR2474]|uniref:ESPR-type extended signal peptide-containing protein n=1 Tax=Lonepinella sp. BR2474 TaxID=3434548 RepID=UPI003F6DF675